MKFKLIIDNEKDEELETTIFHSRIYICVGISILMVIVLFCNLYYLQIISYYFLLSY